MASPTNTAKIQRQLPYTQSTLPKQQHQVVKETKMRFIFLLFVLWIATCIGWVITAANPARLLSATSQSNRSSQPSPDQQHSPLHREKNDLTRTFAASQPKKLEPSPGTGGRPYSGPQIFAISYASVFGIVMLGCLVWIWSGRFFGNQCWRHEVLELASARKMGVWWTL